MLDFSKIAQTKNTQGTNVKLMAQLPADALQNILISLINQKALEQMLTPPIAAPRGSLFGTGQGRFGGQMHELLGLPPGSGLGQLPPEALMALMQHG